MNITALKENAKTLAAALGIDEDTAETLLDASVLITVDAADEVGTRMATELELLLQRTVSAVTRDIDSVKQPDVEVIIGTSASRSRTKCLFVGITDERIEIGEARRESQVSSIRHQAFLLIGACFTAAKALACYLGERFPFSVDELLIIDFRAIFGEDLDSFREPVDLGTVYLAGAGAVGNGFLYGLRYFDVQGTIHVVDPKLVKEGNLNRCMFYDKDDLGLQKANRLCSKAQPFFNKITLIPRNHDLRDSPERHAGRWLERLVVTVDSRRGRRNLQNEMPGEVYDASTTGIQEVVVHFNQQPTAGKACLSCIYLEENGELTHEGHVADLLGVGVDKVRETFIDSSAAMEICRRYPTISPEAIQGTAYDSLFKQLCGQGELQIAADKHVLAPFAFVSVLAGAMLAVEMVRRVRKGQAAVPYNYWRLAPYSTPNIRGRYNREKVDGCEFCGDPVRTKCCNQLWGID
ncbi:MAG: hypothetical protein FDZ69_13195 [Deltaproteobacteria bacterium]|nr:MAG: hypothetical protein FDZ69_13195 [Deltaproteobacteria bacterium]